PGESALRPVAPFSAGNLRLSRQPIRVLRFAPTSRNTEPPSPPSPPLGPPFSMTFSRRKLIMPLPPSPAFTKIETSSTNFMDTPPANRAGQQIRHYRLLPDNPAQAARQPG